MCTSSPILHSFRSSAISTADPNPQLAAILAHVRWHVRPERLALVGLLPHERRLALHRMLDVSAPFAQIIVEPHVVTLLLPEAEWHTLQAAFPHARVELGLRAIGFDMDLPPDLVGFMAAVTQELAHAGVWILAVCGYDRDTIIVRDADLARASAAIARILQHGE